MEPEDAAFHHPPPPPPTAIVPSGSSMSMSTTMSPRLDAPSSSPSSLRARCEELAESDRVDKAAALVMLKLQHTHETMLLEVRHEKETEVARVRHEIALLRAEKERHDAYTSEHLLPRVAALTEDVRRVEAVVQQLAAAAASGKRR